MVNTPSNKQWRSCNRESRRPSRVQDLDILVGNSPRKYHCAVLRARKHPPSPSINDATLADRQFIASEIARNGIPYLSLDMHPAWCMRLCFLACRDCWPADVNTTVSSSFNNVLTMLLHQRASSVPERLARLHTLAAGLGQRTTVVELLLALGAQVRRGP